MTPVRDRLRHSPAVVKFYTVKLLLFIFPATYSLIFLPPFSFANGILSISITGCFAYSFSLNSTLKCLPQLSPNGFAVWLVADFKALPCQVTTTFDTSCAALIPTAPAINYTACWQLVFIHIHLFVINLAFIFKSFSNCTNLSTKHKFILFF